MEQCFNRPEPWGSRELRDSQISDSEISMLLRVLLGVGMAGRTYVVEEKAEWKNLLKSYVFSRSVVADERCPGAWLEGRWSSWREIGCTYKFVVSKGGN